MTSTSSRPDLIVSLGDRWSGSGAMLLVGPVEIVAGIVVAAVHGPPAQVAGGRR